MAPESCHSGRMDCTGDHTPARLVIPPNPAPAILISESRSPGSPYEWNRRPGKLGIKSPLTQAVWRAARKSGPSASLIASTCTTRTNLSGWPVSGTSCERLANSAAVGRVGGKPPKGSLCNGPKNALDELEIRRIQCRPRQELDMRRIDWNAWITALTLVHLGQQLGTDSKLSRAIFDIGELLAAILR